MRPVWGIVMILGCGSPDPGVPAKPTSPIAAKPLPPPPPPCGTEVPAAACTVPTVTACAADDPKRGGEWRYALVGGPFELVEDVAHKDLVDRWRAESIGASLETEGVLAKSLGARTAKRTIAAGAHPELDAAHWAIVPVDQLSPAWSVITVDGAHPLATGDTPLVVPLCGAPVKNIDPTRVTTLVMSGTTALTGRTAERIDSHGVDDTVKFIKPFFASADLVHISNEVSFVKDCHPRTGQTSLVFCARDRYIDLLASLKTSIIELTGSHLIDYGHRSLMRTIAMYEKRGWHWFGGGRTQIEATTPLLVENHGNKLAFLGCNAVNWWIKAIWAGSGGAHCDYARMAWQIQDLRRRGYTPIVSVQHGELLTHKPDWDLVADLRKLAEAGAAFVQGSQAHVAHPWDVHHGSFVHYGPGNILFAQHPEYQKEAAVDKLYFHDGKLLTVGHILVRTEHGQPRLLLPPERARFLDQMSTAEAGIKQPEPWAPVALAPETRDRPDSLVVHGRSQRLAVTVPASFDPKTHYPLVVALDATVQPSSDQAYVVRRAGKTIATADEIVEFMRTKYAVDPKRITLSGIDPPIDPPTPFKRWKKRRKKR